MNTLAVLQSGELSPLASSSFDDDRALAGWLTFVALRNQQTHRSYLTEVTRFRIFLATVHRTTPGRDPSFLMRDATEVDIALYEAHLVGMLRTGEPITPLVVPAEILNRFGRKDQPFLAPESANGPLLPLRLKASSANQAIAILHALYRHWMQPDPQTRMAYVGANPVQRIKRSTVRMSRQLNRNFPAEAVTAMMQTLELQRMAINDQSKTAAASTQQLARRRWITALLFGLWGRRAEIAQLRMNNFQFDGRRWLVRLSRKGGKEQDLPAAPWVMQELSRYRMSMGLSPLPSSQDESPAIARLRETSDPESTVNPNLIYKEVCEVARATALALRERKVLVEIAPEEAELIASRLDDVSPHWFRHSGATIAVNSGAMSLENASKMLGHSSTAVTASMYYHPDDAQIEQGMQSLGSKVLGTA